MSLRKGSLVKKKGPGLPQISFRSSSEFCEQSWQTSGGGGGFISSGTNDELAIQLQYPPCLSKHFPRQEPLGFVTVVTLLY